MPRRWMPLSSFPRLGALIAACFGLLLPACTTHEQVQYFAAVDRDTGVTQYYKMTVDGRSALLGEYNIQAGYFSAEAVDVLRGNTPDLPILDLPIEQLDVFDWLAQRFYAALIQEAQRRIPVEDPAAMRLTLRSTQRYNERRAADARDQIAALRATTPTDAQRAAVEARIERLEQSATDFDLLADEAGQLLARYRDAAATERDRLPRLTEADLRGIARLVYFGSLSASDLASMGREGSSDAYQFRKLVFWATAENIDLNRYAGQIDSVIDSVVVVAQSARTEQKRRAAEQKARRDGIRTALIQSLRRANSPELDLVLGLFEAANPTPSSALNPALTASGAASTAAPIATSQELLDLLNRLNANLEDADAPNASAPDTNAPDPGAPDPGAPDNP